MFQLSQQIISNYNDKTALSLIYATKTLEEMAFVEDLAKYDAKGKLNFYPVIENIDIKNWKFGSGFINEEMIESLMPVPNGKFN